MQTVKIIATVLALLVVVTFLIATWYVVVAAAIIFVLYLAVSIYFSIKAVP